MEYKEIKEVIKNFNNKSNRKRGTELFIIDVDENKITKKYKEINGLTFRPVDPNKILKYLKDENYSTKIIKQEDLKNTLVFSPSVENTIAFQSTMFDQKDIELFADKLGNWRSISSSKNPLDILKNLSNPIKEYLYDDGNMDETIRKYFFIKAKLEQSE